MARDPIRATKIRIAKQTLNMPDAIANIAGGPTKAEARRILREEADRVKKKSAATRKRNKGRCS